MKSYRVRISDVGTATELILRAGSLTVINSGGCPAEELLVGLRCYRDPHKLAAVILRRWCEGYDGSPRGNSLSVSVWDLHHNQLAYVEAR